MPPRSIVKAPRLRAQHAAKRECASPAERNTSIGPSGARVHQQRRHPPAVVKRAKKLVVAQEIKGRGPDRAQQGGDDEALEAQKEMPNDAFDRAGHARGPKKDLCDVGSLRLCRSNVSSTACTPNLGVGSLQLCSIPLAAFDKEARSAQSLTTVRGRPCSKQ